MPENLKGSQEPFASQGLLEIQNCCQQVESSTQRLECVAAHRRFRDIGRTVAMPCWAAKKGRLGWDATGNSVAQGSTGSSLKCCLGTPWDHDFWLEMSIRFHKSTLPLLFPSRGEGVTCLYIDCICEQTLKGHSFLRVCSTQHQPIDKDVSMRAQRVLIAKIKQFSWTPKHLVETPKYVYYIWYIILLLSLYIHICMCIYIYIEHSSYSYIFTRTDMLRMNMCTYIV